VALGAVEGLTGSASLVAAIGTDGIDGPTDAAGALATGSTLERSRVAHLDLQSALERNDAYGFFDGLSDLIRSGPTGTNVMDLYLALRER
jgi:hydroxypyruvate reductase